MVAFPTPSPLFHVTDPTDGDPLAGGKVYTYAVGTTTDKLTWADRAKVAANTNPVILDANGDAPIFLDGDYKLRVTRADDTLVYEIDGVSSSGGGGASGGLTGEEEIVTAATRTVVSADEGMTLVANRAGGVTFNFSAAATLGETYMIVVKNIGAGDLVLDPNAAETIDGLASVSLKTNQSAIVTSNGTALRTLLLSPGTTMTGTGDVVLATAPTLYEPILSVADAATTTVSRAATIRHETSGSAAAGLGVSLAFSVENAAGAQIVGVTLDAIAKDVAAGTEDFNLDVNMMRAGAAPVRMFRFNNDGHLEVGTTTLSGTDNGFRIASAFPQTWELAVSAANGEFYLYDQTSGLFPVSVSPGTPDDALTISSSGISSAALPFNTAYTSSAAAIRYGYIAQIKGSGTATQHVVAAQLNAHSLNTSGARSVWGIATEAWTGDISTAPSVTASLIGAETSIISQYHANSSALIGMDIVFKNRPDGVAAAPGGLGSNAYNLNSRAIQIDAQARSSSGEYSGWVTGILFSANSIDRSNAAVNGVLIDASAVDPARLAAGFRLPDGIGLSWTSDVRTLRYSSGSLVWRVSGVDVTAFDGNGTPGFNRGIAVPAGGNNAYGIKMSSTANLGIFFGSGAPTLSAAQGSVYMRTDGSSTTTRMYVNTNGTSGWTNVTTAT